ncbi:MAG: penicillin-binding protein 2 [Gammaproteobacteria bacterium]|nr:penicillin-binding protein 2 [Gammaproteobacteria bacterium]MCP4088599.1 penicillin-binding protein 2 [Gammaproteobacteria bacterium]MCP4276493.1 penicillin-binding protein 2 [Gammaproteobacteria bacterium]MCP4832370.1 penicillin-binding protein 2 [Gammaproteobacteria bacterium]MCP4929116.1 penicillin-binding protein 2 [Gammaproteobacteria bacterium]
MIAAGFLALGATALMARSVQLQLFDQAFLNEQADARQIRHATISAHRGSITDRNGEVLAVSTPVDSVWVNPQELVSAPERIPMLAKLLGINQNELTARLSRNAGKKFLYLKRHMKPADAERIEKQDIPGVNLQREYRRYYPAAEVTGHLIGFANIDDVGQEGLELAFDHRLAGHPGSKRVLKDRRGQFVEDIERIKAPEPGQDIVTSIDLRIQYLAYRELKKAVQSHKASSGSAVVIDVLTGEVLAMVNQPSYNPNDRAQLQVSRFRNRAITDIFEPGSSIKPLLVAAALETGKYRPGTIIDTSPGQIKVASKVIKDKHNLGKIDVTTMLSRSSNVGASMMALSLEPADLWGTLNGFGLGHASTSGFPGESAGVLSHYANWRPISQATLAYGYGASITPLQLAQAYAVMGAEGLQRPVSLVRINQPVIPRRIISPESANAVLLMMEAVVNEGGTGTAAAVPGFRVAGKTGTTRKFGNGGYFEDRYTAIFAGIAPVTNPRLAVAVVIDDPQAGQYYGGLVAAPVFSKIVADTTRVLAIPPDDREGILSTVALR